MRTLFHSRFYSLTAACALTAAALLAPSKSLLAEGTLAQSAHRIVAVGGSVTEIVFALGEEDRLVARDTTSNHPASAAKLPDVGYIRALSPEGVMSVDPDLILMLEGSGPVETVDVLKKSGVAIADIPEEFTDQGILNKVLAVGEALGVPEKAEKLAEKLKVDLETAQSEADMSSSDLRVLFILTARDGRILASGSETAASGIIALAGARNAVDDFSGYKQLSDEAVLSAAPDVVLMMQRGENHNVHPEEVFDHPALAQTPAGQNKRVIVMGGQYLLGFGPRTADAIRELSDQLSDIRS
ncbi:MAG: ABC transporter substrate-binding protein [Roseibium sp.]|uniref:heme/hemin ABC transporter substrate-binding protein n=1 Tax=Roseibium sp. TaxID=1936156 RepID=UPI00262F542A|nr:ABC transporter substrate-binding protein [Roseibium sp.]MCV0429248.1 ABC transporter substrate-binding protein [Roseibium sp.]